jgi:LEA14-like dessication related protein
MSLSSLGRTLARSILAAAVGLAAFGPGCSSAPPLEPLGVNLVNLEIQEVTLFEASVIARVRITNPNPEPIALAGGSLKMLLDGRKIGTALCAEAFTVPAFDSAVVSMSVTVNTATAITRIPQLLEQDVVTYGVRGAFYSDGSFGRRAHAVERSGSLDLSGPRAPLDGAAAPPTS